jgi:hypothetical protein
MPVRRKVIIIIALADADMISQMTENIVLNSQQIAITLPIGDIIFLNQQYRCKTYSFTD